MFTDKDFSNQEAGGVDVINKRVYYATFGTRVNENLRIWR